MKQPNPNLINLSRRDLFKTTGALAGALVGGLAITSLVPSPLHTIAYAAGREGLEKTDLNLGFIPLTDCAVLVMALEKGYFQKHGLKVTLSKEASWANIRDKVGMGMLDGAHMLAPMTLASSLGIGALKVPTITAFSMGLGGNAITVSDALYQRMLAADPHAMKQKPLTAQALKKVIAADQAKGKPALTFAMVFPTSTHNYQLRYWLASAGIDPDKDIRLIVVPPPQMVANMQAGAVDGYCVGEPWNERAVNMGLGHTLITSQELWNNNPEKVLGVTLEWAEKHPNTHQALLRALLETAQWMDQPGNREEVARVISAATYVNAPVEVVRQSITGHYVRHPGGQAEAMPDFNVFHRHQANFPWRSHAVWFLTQMYRWGQIEAPMDMGLVARQVYRPELYRQAAKSLGIVAPGIDDKPEGIHRGAWKLEGPGKPLSLGQDLFFDGKAFNAHDPVGYLTAQKSNHMTVNVEALRKLNPVKGA